MIEVIAAGIAIDAAEFLMAAAAIWLWLRLLDRTSGASFRETYRAIRTDPFAAAVYLGLRFAGSAILFAAVVG